MICHDLHREDVDISASELENRTEAVALFLNRADTEACARDSIITTCQELRMLKLSFTYVHMILIDFMIFDVRSGQW